MTKQKGKNERIYPKILKIDESAFVRVAPISEKMADAPGAELDRDRYLKRIAPIFKKMAEERVATKRRRKRKKIENTSTQNEDDFKE